MSPLVKRLGLAGSLLGTGLMLFFSLVWAFKAYAVAERYGFAPTDMSKKTNKAARLSEEYKNAGLFEKASRSDLVPLRGALRGASRSGSYVHRSERDALFLMTRKAS